MKFEVIKKIMNALYDSGGYVDKDLVTELLAYDIEDLEMLLREVKLKDILDEDKERD